jgi:hypothetical protein
MKSRNWKACALSKRLVSRACSAQRAFAENDRRIASTCSPSALRGTITGISILTRFTEIKHGLPGFLTETLDAVSKILHR